MKKNIAFLLNNVGTGGISRVTANISNNLSDNFNIKIITYIEHEKHFKFNNTIICLPRYFKKSIISKLYNYYMRIKNIKKIKQEYSINTILSSNEAPNIVNIFSKQKDKIILTIHNNKSLESKEQGFLGSIYNLLMNLFYNRANCIVTVSKGIKLDLIKNYRINKNKIKVIYNPYEIDLIIKKSKEELDNSHEKIFRSPTIITAGRLVAQKGYTHLIRAFKKINQEIPNINLVILGNGILEHPLKKLALKLDLGENVFFLGYQENPYKFFKRSKLFVFSSVYEGFGSVLVEAMACQLPVVSTDCISGPREILAPTSTFSKQTSNIEFAEFGVLTPPFCEEKYIKNDNLSSNEDLFANAVIQIINDKKIMDEYIRKGVHRAMDFDIGKIIKQYEEIL